MDDRQNEFLSQLGTHFSLAIEGMLGEQWAASLEDTQIPGDSSEYLCWSQKLNLHAEPLIQVAIGKSAWREVGTRALAAVGLEQPEEADVRATYLELLTQALSGWTRFLGEKSGTEVCLASGAETPLPASGNGAPLQCVRLTSRTGFAVDLFARVETPLLDAVSRHAAAAAHRALAPPAHEEAAHSDPQRKGAPPQVPARASTMELLFDVELPVSVSFGRTQLALKEVIKLGTGSIIELNRMVSEPVEIIVNNCVVAKGEVVVVDGNYGVRIQNIISRSERLRSFD